MYLYICCKDYRSFLKQNYILLHLCTFPLVCIDDVLRKLCQSFRNYLIHAMFVWTVLHVSLLQTAMYVVGWYCKSYTYHNNGQHWLSFGINRDRICNCSVSSYTNQPRMGFSCQEKLMHNVLTAGCIVPKKRNRYAQCFNLQIVLCQDNVQDVTGWLLSLAFYHEIFLYCPSCVTAT